MSTRLCTGVPLDADAAGMKSNHRRTTLCRQCLKARRRFSTPKPEFQNSVVHGLDSGWGCIHSSSELDVKHQCKCDRSTQPGLTCICLAENQGMEKSTVGRSVLAKKKFVKSYDTSPLVLTITVDLRAALTNVFKYEMALWLANYSAALHARCLSNLLSLKGATPNAGHEAWVNIIVVPSHPTLR